MVDNFTSTPAPSLPPKTIIHVYGGTQGSGEQRMLQLVVANEQEKYHHVIIDLGRNAPSTPLFERMAEAGQCHYIPLCLEPDAIGANSVMLSKKIAECRPDIIKGWAYPGNAYALLAGQKLQRQRNAPAILLRLSNPEILDDEQALAEQMKDKWKKAAYHAIAISDEVAANYIGMGMPQERIRVIYNGVDSDKYNPREHALHRFKSRNALGISDHVRLIGLVARFDPQKGIEDFLDAARLLHETPGFEDVHFVLIGNGQDSGNPILQQWIADRGLDSVMHCAGARDTMPQLYHALDINTLSSRSEAFGNAIIEAMACGVPVVATDVGMTKAMLGDTGAIVQAGNPASIADGWKSLFSRPKTVAEPLAKEGVERVRSQFNFATTLQRYIDYYDSIVLSRRKVAMQPFP